MHLSHFRHKKNMEIRNITATTSLDCRLDLNSLHTLIPNSTYKPERFSGLTIRLLEPKASAHLFYNGKVVCIGAKSVEDLDRIGHKISRILNELGYEPKFVGFEVKNMVGSCSVGFQINLPQLLRVYGGSYEPELFPALTCKVRGVTLLVFYTGKVIATGGRNKKTIDFAYNCMYPILQQCRRQ